MASLPPLPWPATIFPKMKRTDPLVGLACLSMLAPLILGADDPDWKRCREGGSSLTTCLLIQRADGSMRSLALWREAYEAGLKAASLTPAQPPQAVSNPTVNNWDRDNAQADAEYKDRLRSIEEEKQLHELSRRFNTKDPTTLALNDFHAERRYNSDRMQAWIDMAMKWKPRTPELEARISEAITKRRAYLEESQRGLASLSAQGPAPISKMSVLSEILRRVGNGARSYSAYMNAVRAQGFAHQYQSLPNLPLSGTAQRLGNSTFYSFSNGMQCIATQLGATVFYNCNR